MRKKTIILNETQLKRLVENRINGIGSQDIANKLSSIGCSGEDLKTLMEDEVSKFGFTDIRIKFLGYTEDKNLMYLLFTEGPIFVVKARSENTHETPCLNIYEVTPYQQV